MTIFAVGAGLVVRLRFAVMIDALIADADADHAVAVPQQLLARKGREDVGAVFFCDSAEPLRKLLQTGNVLARVLHHRRHRKCGNGEFRTAARKIPHLVPADRRLDRSGLAPVGNQLVEAFRIDDGARDPVAADVAALVDQHHGEIVLAALLGERAQLDRSGETGGAATHDEDVDFELIAFRHNAVEFFVTPSFTCAERRCERRHHREAVHRDPIVPWETGWRFERRHAACRSLEHIEAIREARKERALGDRVG
jgi:hypothetical protein